MRTDANDQAQEKSHNQRKHRRRDSLSGHRRADGADHDDDKTGSGKRRQIPVDPEMSGKNEEIVSMFER